MEKIGEITIAGTELTSPNHPRNYPDYKDCFHVIKFKKGRPIELTFLEFDIEGSEPCS